MNVFCFSGNIGADGELRSTQKGEQVVNFRVANSNGFGERKTTQWVECSLWGKRAEALSPHLTKGKQVVVSGELTLREFDKRDGTKGFGLSVRVNDVDLVGSRDGGSGEAGGSASVVARGAKKEAPRHDDLDDEIPF